jgi:NitT/TauT family transport system ATP-binding protein
VRGLHRTVGRGEFVAAGPPGCGKSTTLTLVSGLERSTEGEIPAAGAPVRGVGDKVGSGLRQDATFLWRTVLSPVMAGPCFRGVPEAEAKRKASEWPARFGPAAFEDRRPQQLSGGQRERVARSATFGGDSATLLMDEPFGVARNLVAHARILGASDRRVTLRVVIP